MINLYFGTRSTNTTPPQANKRSSPQEDVFRLPLSQRQKAEEYSRLGHEVNMRFDEYEVTKKKAIKSPAAKTVNAARAMYDNYSYKFTKSVRPN